MSAEDGLAFGMLGNGRMVGVRDVPNGVGCGCMCPGCGAPLVARQGRIRTWHFSHARGHEACGTGAETALHQMAKQIIAEWNALDLPAHEVRVSRTVHGHHLVRVSTLPGYRFEVRTSTVEQRWAGFNPDVLLRGQGEEMLAVEVCVTHAVDEIKQARVAELNLPMIEYRLSALNLGEWDVASLDQALRAMTPDWILHPLEASTRRQLEGELFQDEVELLREVERRQPTTVVDAASTPFAQPPLEARNQPLAPPKAWTQSAIHFEWNGVAIEINVWATAAVWICTSDLGTQARMLAHLEADARDFDLHCDEVIRTQGHGVLIASGTAAKGWAETLESRLAGVIPTIFQPEEYIR